MFSILIPSWNNLPYLKLCVESIEKHTTLPYEILVHVNEGADGSAEWLQAKGIPFSRSASNIGVCRAVNLAAAPARQPYLIYMNDDMYVCPGWDAALAGAIRRQDSGLFMLSATMIEPGDTGNPCVRVADFGASPDLFREAELLARLPELSVPDWYGATWPPVLMPRDCWHEVGGFSLEFSPGMSSDDDLAMKMWQLGCRRFMGVGNSLVYHFQTKSTGRIVKNDGRRQFLMKWGLNQSSFNRYYLQRGAPYSDAPLTGPRGFGFQLEQFRARLKRALKS